jgi:hypothetical protein
LLAGAAISGPARPPPKRERVLLVGRMEAVQVDRGVRSSSVQKTAEQVATPEQHGASDLSECAIEEA